MVKIDILVAGATGYIGGSVLKHLLAHPSAKSFNITALVRSADKAQKFENFGINSVVGSFDNEELLEDLAENADVVFDMVDADGLRAAHAMFRGFKKKYQKTGKAPIFIHTSGTGLLADDAAGLYATDTIWNDADADQLEKLPDTAPHRDVDLAIINADKEGYVKAYLVAPSTIYGLASGKFVDAGLQHRQSQQIPALIRASLDRGRAGMVGKGLNIWPNVHIEDVAELYIILYDSIIANPHTGHGCEGYYFGENGEHSLYSVAEEIGRVLVELEKSSVVQPTTFNEDEIKKHFNGSTSLGSNSRCRANRSRAIGWKPRKTTQDLLESVRPEVKLMIKRSK